MEQTDRVRAGMQGTSSSESTGPNISGHRSFGEIPALLDGTRPVQLEALAVLLRERARLAVGWFPPIQRPDGSFAYTYDPAHDQYTYVPYNEVRHGGATYAIFQACQLFDDQLLRSCASKAAGYIVNSSLTVPSGGAAYLYNGRAKLGGVALAIVALLEGRRALAATTWDDAARSLGEFILGMELADEPGRYFQSYHASSHEKLLVPNSDYYPGEALLALTRLHRAFPDGPWLATAQRAARYLIRVKDGDQIKTGAIPRVDHWLTIALSELYRFDPNPDYAAIVTLQANRMIELQYPADDPEPWRIGAGRRAPTPNFTSTATHAEALNAAWELAHARGDNQTVERLSRAAVRSVQFLMRVQYTAENTAGFARPNRALGAWAQDIDHPLIRFDYVQHSLSALIGAFRLLETGAEAAKKPEPARGQVRIVATTLVEQHNSWSTEPVLRLTLRCAPAGSETSKSLGAVRLRLTEELARLPGNPSLAFDESEAAAGSDNLALGFLIARAALTMQQRLGDDVAFARVWPGATPDDVELAIGYRYAPVGTAAGQLAVWLVKHLLDARAPSFDFPAEFERQLVARHPSRGKRSGNWYILAEAKRRGIPARSLDWELGMVELGNGAYRQRYWNLSTSGTSHHGVKIAKDKHLASQMLRDAGLPVPRSAVANSVREATRAAAHIGYPVVLKPNRGNRGRNVFVDIENDAELTEIINTASGDRFGGEWLVEAHVDGNGYRILVIGGQVAATIQRTPPSVLGNGSSTVQELIDELNADPARSSRPESRLKPVVLGPRLMALLHRQRLELDSVPEPGQLILLNALSNISTGGSTRDVTDRIHPDNALVACMAAGVAGLDFAGIDMVLPDIGQSIWATGGGIVEINSSPGVNIHHHPIEGDSHDTSVVTLAMLFPPGQPVRARMVTVLESAESAAICRLLAHILAAAGRRAGVAGSAGLSIDGMELRGVDARHPRGIRTLLNNPALETAIVEISRAAIEEHGLGFDACDVAVISDAFDKGEQESGRRSVEAVLAGALDPSGAIVVDRSQMPSLDALAPADPRIVSFARRPTEPNDASAASAPTVMPRGRGKRQSIAVLDAGQVETVVSPAQLTAMTERIARDALLAAIAAAAALKVPPETIRAALLSFNVRA